MEARRHPLLGYYALHAPIYDATRWSFLFGRDRLVALAARNLPQAAGSGRPRIVEVGCGTGRNLRALARTFPSADILGIDLSPSMLGRAGRAVAGAGARVRLACAAYAPDTLPAASADLIVFSYVLSMVNPGFEAALDAARAHLAPGGLVAVADFCASRFDWFRSWMGVNHVRLDGHLPPALAGRFATVHMETRPAYGGLWDYFCCLGRAARAGGGLTITP